MGLVCAEATASQPAHRVTCCGVPTDAARVLSREDLALQNTRLRVRKAARTDPRRLLLRGLRPDTSVDHVEMYVENTLDLDQEDYQLNFTPARDSVLIHLSQPSSQGLSFCLTPPPPPPPQTCPELIPGSLCPFRFPNPQH